MKQPNSARDPPAQPPTSALPARTRAELIENLAVLVVRKHRQRRRQPPAADPAGPTSSSAPPTP
jgi:hypothetical protein